MMSDHLVRAMATNGAVRGLACVTTELVREACSRHGTLPTASVALGRALTGGALFGALLKTGQRVALKFEGNGPLRKILVEADPDGSVRGCVGVPEVDLPLRNGRLDVAGAIGRAGLLTVAKDLRMKEPYQGTVLLASSEVGEDLAWYLTESEQIPSAVGLGVLLAADGSVAAAGGFLLQALPPRDEAVVEAFMERIGRLPPLSELFAGGTTPEDLLATLYGEFPYQTLERRALAFRCSCSRERIERVLLSLGAAELGEMLVRQKGAGVTCEFCRQVYTFSSGDLELLLAELRSQGGGTC